MPHAYADVYAEDVFLKAEKLRVAMLTGYDACKPLAVGLQWIARGFAREFSFVTVRA